MNKSTQPTKITEFKEYTGHIGITKGDDSSSSIGIEKKICVTSIPVIPKTVSYKKEEPTIKATTAVLNDGKLLVSLDCELIKTIGDLAYLKVYSGEKGFEIAVDLDPIKDASLNYVGAHFSLLVIEDQTGVVKTKFESISQKSIWQKMAQEINIDAIFE